MRVYNFSGGPAVLPEEVLAQARDEMLDWHGSGMSVMEMSHRGKEFMAIAEQAEADLRELLAIPMSYKVLFLQGGATSQFAMVPMNLLRGRVVADYVHTGEWVVSEWECESIPALDTPLDTLTGVAAARESNTPERKRCYGGMRLTRYTQTDAGGCPCSPRRQAAAPSIVEIPSRQTAVMVRV